MCYDMCVPSKRSSKTPERELHGSIEEYLTEAFMEKFGNCHLEITANGAFSELLKKIVRQDIIFTFLGKKASPDIAGFVHSRRSELVVLYSPSKTS